MGLFNWFGDQEHNTYDYKPIYYDKEKDELRKKFSKVDGSLEKEMEKEKEDGTYVPGSYIKGAFRDGHYQRSVRSGHKAQNIIGLTGLLLIFIVFILIAKFYTIL